LDKNQILKKFSEEPDKYYNVKLFQDKGLPENHAQSVADSFGH